ncbi:bacterio-opsin activator domain-containing protein [Natrinema gelatinilyticum]|uniref:helix-turn-helix domain-containing protein n=1 Tax=Natrinema gelatinilyticum TaxID=2961571 RepID=UPI0020C5ADDE|nr:helix-turn-helix domain-containing protein [Natrinema gelatinilyticum]
MSIVTTRLSIPSEHLEFGQILQDGPDVQIELTQFVPTGDMFVPYFWVATADPASFEDAVRSDERVGQLERLKDGPKKYLYRVTWATDLDGFIRALRTHDLVVEKAVGTSDEWQFRLRGPDHDNLSAFREVLIENGIRSTVKAVWNPHGSNSDPYGLTDKQREAVELAFAEGYFDVPSKTNLTELADVVGITRQSFSRRLSRGLHAILTDTVMAEV